MGTLTPTATTNVSVQSISGTTSSSTGSTGNVTSQPTSFHVNVTTPPLVVQISIENYRAEAGECVVSVSDSSGNGGFYGEATLDWDEGDSDTLWVQFSDFPLKSDGSTPTDACDYALVLNSGTQMSAVVYTV
jgi:hypothetical protein